jgi:hypothetical protein
MLKIIFKNICLILILNLLISKLSTANTYWGKKWIIEETHPIEPMTSEAQSLIPWFYQSQNLGRCIAEPISESIVNENGVTYKDIVMSFDGGTGDSFCFYATQTQGAIKKNETFSRRLFHPSMTIGDRKKNFNSTNTSSRMFYTPPPALFQFQMNAVSTIFDVTVDGLCADKLPGYVCKADNAKKDIDNCISCQCPDGGDARFDDCPYTWKWSSDVPDLTTLMNSSYKSADFDMCINVVSNGLSSGCVFNHKWTNYYIKTYLTFGTHPIFRLRKNSVNQFLGSWFNDGQTGNFSLGSMGDALAGNYEVHIDNFENSEHIFTDYYFVSTSSNFGNLDSIYAIHSDRVNPVGEYQLDKLCSIRILPNGPDFNLEKVSNDIKNNFKYQDCHPKANGEIRSTISRLADIISPASKLTNVLDPNSLHLDTTNSKLFIADKAKMNVRFRLPMPQQPGSNVIVEYLTDISNLLSASFSCDSTYNEDGYKCNVTTQSNQPGTIVIWSETTNTVITTLYIQTGTNFYSFIAFPESMLNGTSKFCALDASNNKFCTTLKLVDNIVYTHDQGNVTNSGQDNIMGNGTGGNTLVGSDGKWNLGGKILFGALIGIGSLVILVLLGPLLMHAVIFAFSKIKASVSSIGPAIKNATEKLKSKNYEANIEEPPVIDLGDYKW